MAKNDNAKAEIRAIFPNEVSCEYEAEAHPSRSRLTIFERTITLAGMNAADGKVCSAHIVYAIHTDGYWEQVACQCGPWEARGGIVRPVLHA